MWGRWMAGCMMGGWVHEGVGGWVVRDGREAGGGVHDKCEADGWMAAWWVGAGAQSKTPWPTALQLKGCVGRFVHVEEALLVVKSQSASRPTRPATLLLPPRLLPCYCHITCCSATASPPAALLLPHCLLLCYCLIACSCRPGTRQGRPRERHHRPLPGAGGT